MWKAENLARRPKGSSEASVEEYDLLVVGIDFGTTTSLVMRSGRSIQLQCMKLLKEPFKPGNTAKQYIVSIPAEAFGKSGLDDTTREAHIKDGRIHFQSSHIQATFTNSFNGINRLVDDQISRATKQKLSVNCSPIRWNETVRGCASSVPQNAALMRLRRRTDICRGAVFKGFLDGISAASGSSIAHDNINAPIRITSTVARASLGIKYRASFDNQSHREEDKEWDSDEKEWKAADQMEWRRMCLRRTQRGIPSIEPTGRTQDVLSASACGSTKMRSHLRASHQAYHACAISTGRLMSRYLLSKPIRTRVA
ncbi:hypothetical protein BU23DRAFT_567713 [Bimuria novae-zelandiae CBS 107.79]|uniref:Actin-like ATPase domain-containing protein n=1 Tax=Bimuria novae-zelandiae CBS 107.79 TaxID=1447943 RepID=A0A6A5VAQ4_9PLEO|nr:hypothetical protein BU23DRAFT_567713 [Bimuria novae-zelandiae CBS 107.79]